MPGTQPSVRLRLLASSDHGWPGDRRRIIQWVSEQEQKSQINYFNFHRQNTSAQSLHINANGCCLPSVRLRERTLAFTFYLSWNRLSVLCEADKRKKVSYCEWAARMMTRRGCDVREVFDRKIERTSPSNRWIFKRYKKWMFLIRNKIRRKIQFNFSCRWVGEGVGRTFPLEF